MYSDLPAQSGIYPTLVEGLKAIFGAYLLMFVIIAIITAILSLVAMTQIFRKAGIAGWKAWVPVYNAYLLYQITFGNGWLFLLTLVPVVGYIMPCVMEFNLAKVFGASTAFAVLSIFFSPITRLILAFGEYEYQNRQYN